MKPSFFLQTLQNLSMRFFALAACWIASVGLLPAQVVTIVHSFGDWSLASDGTYPTGLLIAGTNGALYGTTSQGGGSGGGCAFVTSAQGAIIYLHRFGNEGLANDGLNPNSGLVRASDGNYYGTTSAGGSAGKGTVFRMNSLGGITIIHSFRDGSVPNDGSVPLSTLLEGSDGNLYGTTSAGGSAGKGTIFTMTFEGKLTIVHHFGDGSVSNDGATPRAGLTQDLQGNLYGTTVAGGATNEGTVFVVNPQKQLSLLYSFSKASTVAFSLENGYGVTGSGGFYPNSRLLLGADGNLYGTTSGSACGYGALFPLTPDGQETVLHYFGDGTVPNDGRQGTEGENALIQASDRTIYGTTSAGGAAGKGAVFALAADGALSVLHSFADGTVANDGATPEGGVVLDTDGNFYGMTSAGGSAGLGTIFRLAPAIPAITSALAVKGAVGVPFNYQVTATNPANGNPQVPETFSASGLPDGLSIEAKSGRISGSPTRTGTTRAIVTVMNGAGSSSVALSITIVPPPVIISALNAFASTGSVFNYHIQASSDPTSFGAAGLPAGLQIDPDRGTIWGIPAATGTFSTTIWATNLAGTDTQTLTLVVTSTEPSLSQEYVLLHSFHDGSLANDGDYPVELIQGLDRTLYGATGKGGAQGAGTVIDLSAAGGTSVLGTLGDANGSHPMGLIQTSDGSFYGTARDGGSADKGTIFKVSPNGALTLLHTFGDGTVANDGANPQAGLFLASDGNFYGTTQYGGSANLGTIYKISPAGVLTILHSFGDGSVNHDGAQPVAALVQVGEVFYGTTLAGGSAGNGVVFSLDTSGHLTILHHFGDGSVANDGQMPHAALTPSPTSATTLYGTTVVGGTLSKGTIFKISTTGVETILHHFGDGSVAHDGINPMGHLLAITRPQWGVTLYGTTQGGGAADTDAGFGTIFQFSEAKGLTIIHRFGDGSVSNDGQTPLAGLCLGSDGNLYGTTMAGGTGYGTAFAVVANLNNASSQVLNSVVGQWSYSGSLPNGLTFDSATGAIVGAPTLGNSIGVYRISVTSPQNVTTLLTVALTESYGQWASSMSASQGADSISRKDGVPNLMKYVFDIDPTAPMTAADRATMPSAGVTTHAGTDYLTLTYRRNATMNGTSITLQTSTDMVNWKPIYVPDYSAEIGTDAATGDPIVQVGVKATNARQFIRLKVVGQ